MAAIVVLTAAALALAAAAEPALAIAALALPLAIAFVPAAWRALSGDRAMLLAVLITAVFLVDAVFRVRSYADKSIDFQILLKASTWSLLLAIAAVRLQTAASVLLSGGRLLWTLFFGWMLLTTSYAPNPLYAMIAVISLISFFLFFASISRIASLEDCLIAILIACLLLAIVSLIVFVAVPSLGRTRIWVGNTQVISNRLAGVAGNANSIGRICCLGLIIVALCWGRIARIWRWLPAVSIALLLLTLLLSNSRTSMLVALIIIVLHVFARSSRLHWFAAGLAVAAMGLMLMLPFSEQILMALSRSGRADEIATGTSRTLIWHVVSTLSWQKPAFGWGYGSTVFILPQYERFMGHAAPHAHNIVLQLWLTTGFVGVALFALALTQRFIAAIANGERKIIALLLFVFLNGLTESSAFGGIANITSVGLALAATMRDSSPPESRAVVASPGT